MSDDLSSHRTLAGDPDRLAAAAAALRRGAADDVFGARFPGEYVMAAVARLLDALAQQIRDGAQLGHAVPSAASDIAEHVLTYLPDGDRVPEE